jgi:hypothetical protein
MLRRYTIAASREGCTSRLSVKPALPNLVSMAERVRTRSVHVPSRIRRPTPVSRVRGLRCASSTEPQAKKGESVS